MNFEGFLIDLGFDVGVNNCDGVVILGLSVMKSGRIEKVDRFEGLTIDFFEDLGIDGLVNWNEEL